jgi:hypothetical protein
MTHPRLLAIIFGGLVWAVLVPINHMFGRGANAAWTLWYFVAYPIILVGAWYLGLRVRSAAWVLGPIAIASSYFVALFVVEQTGSLLPFELMLMAGLAIPAALLGIVASRRAQRGR